MAHEINLVPDVKNDMIKALKLRNLIFFICIVVAIASASVIVVFGSIAGGQQAIANGKKDAVKALSSKLNSYSDLSDFITIKNQLSNLSSIASNKKLLSRTFGILSTLLPNSTGTIQISALSINLEEDPTFSFDAQADATSAPYIDYNVLDSFKKSMPYMRYDYGDYVDRNGDTIPAYCIIENNADGATFYDETGGYYAYWLINGEGCNPATANLSDADDGLDIDTIASRASSAASDNSSDTSTSITSGYAAEEYDGQIVVRIWRTPQFASWYNASSDQSFMTLDGTISGVQHFESKCTTYTGTEKADGTVSWSKSNEDCLLVPDGVEGITISDSSNGRDASGSLVLRFSAVITLNPEVYKFSNHHVMAVAPSGRRNVTDSYSQIQSMFAERAADCADDDVDCLSAVNSTSDNANTADSSATNNNGGTN